MFTNDRSLKNNNTLDYEALKYFVLEAETGVKSLVELHRLAFSNEVMEDILPH
jgi:hypothetical protein